MTARTRRPVFRVFVAFGGRTNPREYAFAAPTAQAAMAKAQRPRRLVRRRARRSSRHLTKDS